MSGFDFETLPSQISEILDENLNLPEKIRHLARQKARACPALLKPLKSEPFLVLAADTIVSIDDMILGKPKDEAEALSHLRILSGRAHKVITAVAMIDSSTRVEFVDHAETEVFFHKLDDEDIQTYIQSGEPFDKAGGYGVQGLGARFIKEIRGDYDCVVGLPMRIVRNGFSYFAQKIPEFSLVENEHFTFLKKQILFFQNEVSGANAQLIAVTKTKPVLDIVAAWLSGQRAFGENYVQEAIEKKKKVAVELQILSHDSPALKWHFIGHLQRNKVKPVVGEFDLIHSVDSLRLAEEISKAAEAKGVRQKILLELNSAGESSKTGIAPADYTEIAKRVGALNGIELCGLMALPPIWNSEEETRAHYQKIKEVFVGTRQTLAPECRSSFVELSMGTTSDYKIALEFGATMIRIGTAIFGARTKPETVLA